MNPSQESPLVSQLTFLFQTYLVLFRISSSGLTFIQIYFPEQNGNIIKYFSFKKNQASF